MAKWWSPVLTLHALDDPHTLDVFTYYRSSGTPNARPNVDCTLTKFLTHRGEASRLLLVIQGYYDDGWNTARTGSQDLARTGMYRKLTYTTISGDAGNETTGAVEHTNAASIFQGDVYVVRPNAAEIHETSVYFPFMIYSLDAFDTIADTYGSNGLFDGASEYVSQSEYNLPSSPASGPNPASQNSIRELNMWWDESVLGLGTPANQYFQCYQNAEVSSLCGGMAAELNGGPGGWPISGDARFYDAGFFADGAGHSSTYKLSPSHIPLFGRMRPRDGVPLAALLLGHNFDGITGYGGAPIGEYVATRLQMAWKFGKVDRVWTTCQGNNAEDTGTLTNYVKVV